MNPTVAGYVGFVVAALIIIWAVFEIGRNSPGARKLTRKPSIPGSRSDFTRATAAEELLPVLDEDSNDDSEQDDVPESNLHTRAQQNGHYSESKKPL